MLHLKLFFILNGYFRNLKCFYLFKKISFLGIYFLVDFFLFIDTIFRVKTLLVYFLWSWTVFLLFFKILLYLHYISGENGVLQILFVIVGTNMLNIKWNMLPPSSRKTPFRKLNNKAFILHVWAHTKNTWTSKNNKDWFIEPI